MHVLYKLLATAAYRVIQEYKALESGGQSVVSLGIAGDENIAAPDPRADVYASRTGFSAEPGRLRKEE